MDSFDVNPFASSSTSTRIDYLFHLRRATHRFLVRHAATLWATEQRRSGWRTMAPPHIAALPARQQPEALAADEAARFKRAHLYGLDDAATAAAVALGADMVDYTAAAETGRPPGVDARRGPAHPDRATAVGQRHRLHQRRRAGDRLPPGAAHAGSDVAGLVARPPHHRPQRHRPTRRATPSSRARLRKFGPLGSPEIATTLTPRPDATPETNPATDAPSADLQGSAHPLALTSTVLASWALLTTSGAAHLIKRQPTAAQAANDRRAGLKPRPATLATGPIDTKTVEGLGRDEENP